MPNYHIRLHCCEVSSFLFPFQQVISSLYFLSLRGDPFTCHSLFSYNSIKSLQLIKKTKTAHCKIKDLYLSTHYEIISSQVRLKSAQLWGPLMDMGLGACAQSAFSEKLLCTVTWKLWKLINNNHFTINCVHVTSSRHNSIQSRWTHVVIGQVCTANNAAVYSNTCNTR